jgi:hypothetical protein
MDDSWFDPQSIQEQIKRRLAGVPGQLAEGLSRVIRDAPEERVQQVMSTPARRVILDGIFWQLPKYFDRKRAGELSTTVCWEITDRDGETTDTYWLRVADGACQVLRDGTSLEPSVTITVDGVEFLQLVTGNADAMQAYLSGRIVITGDVMLAAQVISLFKLPAAKR